MVKELITKVGQDGITFYNKRVGRLKKYERERRGDVVERWVSLYGDKKICITGWVDSDRYLEGALTKLDAKELYGKAKMIPVYVPVYVTRGNFGSEGEQMYLKFFIKESDAIRRLGFPLSLCELISKNKINFEALEEVLTDKDNLKKILGTRYNRYVKKEKEREGIEKNKQKYRYDRNGNKNKDSLTTQTYSSSTYNTQPANSTPTHIEQMLKNAGMDDNFDNYEDIYHGLIKRKKKRSTEE